MGAFILAGHVLSPMPETVLFKTEQHSTRGEVASYLRTVADRLDTGEGVSLESGGESVTMDSPETVEFEVKTNARDRQMAPAS